MPPVVRPAPGGVEALDALLRELGPQLRRGEAPRDPPGRCATGLLEVDRALGGGFPRGRLSEVVGPASSGRTSLALALLAATTRAGELAAVVDVCDAFDPPSAEAAGVDLARVLWVRAGAGSQAAALRAGPRRAPGASLRGAERLLQARGFALVLLDLAEDVAPAAWMPRAVWPRLVRAAAGSATALVLIGAQRLAGTFSTLTLELDPARPRFSGVPTTFDGLEGRILLARNRSGPSERSAPLRLTPRVRAA